MLDLAHLHMIEAPMARRKANKLQAVRDILQTNPQIKTPDLLQRTRHQGHQDVREDALQLQSKISHEKKPLKPPKLAAASANGKSKHVARLATSAPRGHDTCYEDLIRAGRSLGWRRVKDIAESILQSPN
jgi:hypothetical protein